METEPVEIELKILPDTPPGIIRTEVPTSDLPPNHELGKNLRVDEELVDSIRAWSLMQPLVLQKLGKRYKVRGGRRRLMAWRILHKEHEDDGLPPPNPYERIDSNVVEGDDEQALIALELLLNTSAKPDPVQQYEDVVDLMKRGASIEQIVSTTGISRSTVEKRLALKNLHIDLLAGFLARKIALGTAQKAAKLSEAAQTRLAAIYKEKGKITGADVHEQTSALVQAAAMSESLEGLGELPSREDMAQEAEDASDERTKLRRTALSFLGWLTENEPATAEKITSDDIDRWLDEMGV